jgi:cephalosporin-C deacetylase
MHFDLPLHELHTYRPPQTRQPDFEPFWRDTLAAAAQQPLDLRLEPLDLPYRGASLARARYTGWEGAEIVGTWVSPEGDGPFPAVAMYHGYSSTRPDAFLLLSWVLQGYAVLAIDVRGQSGESSDSGRYPGGQVPGYLTRGIEQPASHYYRGAYVDAVRAVEALVSHPTIDSGRVGVVGTSQGGALTLAAAALCALAGSVEVRAAVAEIPFLCHFERAATLVDTEPYREIATYCRRSGADSAQVFRTLSYFDVMNLTSLIRAPTLVTSGLMDMICPPSTIFAAYNNISASKEIFVDSFGEHETFPGVLAARMRWLNTHMA